MAVDNPVTMTDEERDAFLDNGGTGVLSLAAGDTPPYSVPVSYGYDAPTTTFYFRLAVGAERSKGELDDRPATFVTYHETEAGWQSVVANGRLEDVEREGIETETLDGLEHVDMPIIDIFERPTREVDFEFYRLAPDNLTSRAEY
ncbi:pyridoxamine 5'-phosphate oxidase family protein [Haloarcula sp. CBA1130]|uniref:pyridoxamine 5'-phosphate oxidase family protein n=1 Tax=unclassified Haloarcula TaxID=2624677 RepID=UPI001248F411|nr:MULTISPECIES: pyridoxamine 5'-phosphate oxidase family protein [unclassified Haloarcula]KAA9396189.1 pyridoxamine 5'-phosphate oxidase family protein [Haloarcula sp. CBA1129]KAA9400282.1 pyridoxamine 5'-phosphate oxidase family protein [Haloarcula sp. CBA1130]